MIFEEVACPICASRNYFTVWRELAEGSWYRSGIKKEVQVAKCRNCGFIFTNPRPTMATRMLFYDPKTNPDLINRKAECSFDFRQQLRWLAFYYEIVKNIGTYNLNFDQD